MANTTNILGNLGESFATTLTSFFNNSQAKEAAEAAIEEKKLFIKELGKIKKERGKLLEEPIGELPKRIWSFSKVPTTEDVNNDKITRSALKSAAIMIDLKTKNHQKNEKAAAFDLEQRIKCIECSIKKLELNLKLTNEDGIKDSELFTLLEEISKLCGNNEGKSECNNEDLQDFVDEVILKRDMNSMSVLIKLASFICPILAFSNKTLVSQLGEASNTLGNDITNEKSKQAVSICSRIIGMIAGTGCDYKEELETAGEIISFIDATHDVGVIEGLVSFVGLGKTDGTNIEKKIAGSITSIVRKTAKNTIDIFLKTATKYQKFICMAFITLLSTHILLTMKINENNPEGIEDYYSSTIQNVYDNITNTTMRIGNETSITSGGGGIKRRQRTPKVAKQPSKASSKPANATKPLPKTPTAKPTKPTKQPIKPTAKPTNAKAAPKKKKN